MLVLALLAVVTLASTAQNTSEVYYQFHDSRNCGTCDENTKYVIGNCFMTPDDHGVMQYAKATWVTEGSVVTLGFFGGDADCITATGGSWQYTIDECQDHGDMSELVSLTPCERVFYQWFDDSSCDDCVGQETLYVLDRCFQTTNDLDQWEWAMAQRVSETSVQIAFYGNDNTCNTASNTWVYNEDTCVVQTGEFGSEMVSTIASNNICNDNEGLSTFWVVFIVVTSITFAVIFWKMCCRRRRRAPSYAPVAQQQAHVYAQPAQQVKPVYTQPVAQPPVYAPPQQQQQVYAQPVHQQQQQGVYHPPQYTQQQQQQPGY